MHLFNLLLLVAIAAASPLNGLSCSAVTLLVDLAKEQSAATAFCSSYLSIPTITKYSTGTRTYLTTSTVATNTIVAPTSTSTSTVLSTTSTTSYTTSVSTSTTISTVYSYTEATCVAQSSLNKRRAAASPATKPNVLSAYNAGAVLSSACSCLSIPTPTTTVTVFTSTLGTTLVTAMTTTTPTAVTTTTPITTSVVPATTISVTVMTAFTTVVLPTMPAMAQYVIYAGDTSSSAAGQYLQMDSSDNAVFDAAPSAALVLSIDGTVTTNDGYYLAQNRDTEQVYFVEIQEPGIPLTCYIAAQDDGTCPLQCAMVSPYVVLEGDDWYSDEGDNTGDELFTPYAVTYSD